MTDYTTRPDSRFGHQVLEPKPTADELEAFYRQTYYELVDSGSITADIARARRGGEEADSQARWMANTVHRDIIDIIRDQTAGKRVIEVGCGLGEFLVSLRDAGFEPEGVDLANTAVEHVRARGLVAHQGALDQLVADGSFEDDSVDAVLFVNVLELTLDPVENLRAAARILKPGGVVVVRSGNDFSPLQEAAVAALDLDRWWISAPGHIHYLSFDAVEGMMRAAGLEPVHRQSDFPMELFLLLGFPYVGDKELGAECHRRRVAFEKMLPTEARRRLYRAFAEAGMGRCMHVAGRKPEQASR